MVPGVNVIGVSRSGIPPVIEIDEAGHGPYPIQEWEAGLPVTMIWGAKHCTVRGFRIDGTKYSESRKDHAISAAVANSTLDHDIPGFNIEDCEILKLYDGIKYVAGPGSTATGTVRNCSLAGFFPQNGTPNDPQDAGHGAVWLQGAGTTDVDIIDTIITDSHDAIEIEGVQAGMFTTNATLDISGQCAFSENENALELVGVGQAT
jgi:hypothetical protein